MQTAVKLTVEVGDDHVVKLPDEVPVGPAEIIVLVGEPAPGVGHLDDFEPIQPSLPVRLSDLVVSGKLTRRVSHDSGQAGQA